MPLSSTYLSDWAKQLAASTRLPTPPKVTSVPTPTGSLLVNPRPTTYVAPAPTVTHEPAAKAPLPAVAAEPVAATAAIPEPTLATK